MRWLIIAILGWALLYLFVYVPARGNGSDFQMFYAAAYADVHGIDLYNWPALWRVEQLLYNGGVGHGTPFAFSAFVYPPPVALLLRPFTALPESAAYAVWAAFVLASTAAGAYLGLATWPRARRLGATLLVTLSPAALLNVRLGQSGSLVLLSIGAALWLLHARRPWLAGAALTLGLAKPHLGLPIALIVICAAPRGTRRETSLGFAVGVAGWVALTAVLDGGGVFAHWWSSLHNYSGGMRLQPDVASVPGIYYAGAPEKLTGPLNALCLLTAALVLAALARRAWHGSEHERAVLFGAGIATYFALSPYVHSGDQVALTLPLLALIRPDGAGLRHNAVLLAATAAILAPMVVFRDYHTSLINALPPLCLCLAYALRDRQPAGTAQVRSMAAPVSAFLPSAAVVARGSALISEV
jgi:hypothetical protein